MTFEAPDRAVAKKKESLLPLVSQMAIS